MSRNRRLFAAGVVIAAVTAVPAPAAAATKAVYAGPPKPLSGAPEHTEPNAFFPRTVKVAAGDRVAFHFRGFHNVYFAKRGTKAPPAFIGDGQTVQGVNDAAGQPFWFNGQDRIVVNPATAFPSGDGKIDGKAADGSGLPAGDEPRPFEARFPKPGTYGYVCQIHPGMKGKVTVTRSRKGVPSSAADAARIARQARRILKVAKRLARFAGSGDATVRVGNDTTEVAMLRFFPASLSVPVGQTVRFEMPRRSSETHTVTFGGPEVVEPISDGLITPEPAAAGPPALVLNPMAVFPSDVPGLPPYDGTQHGNGFLNSGMLDAVPSPLPAASAVTFSKAGTYTFMCIIHTDMQGTVNVTQ